MQLAPGVIIKYVAIILENSMKQVQVIRLKVKVKEFPTPYNITKQHCNGKSSDLKYACQNNLFDNTQL